MLIAAWVVEAAEIYIYLRDEYPQCHAILESEIAAIEAAGLRRTHIHLRRGAGAYICGEESAMLESIEGKRGLPRQQARRFRPRSGSSAGPRCATTSRRSTGCATSSKRAPDWFTGQGRNGRKGLRTFSVSGRVREPGVKLAPAGITARQLIDEFCGGMAEGHVFKGYLPGGASGGILPATMADFPLDFGTLEAARGCLPDRVRLSSCPTRTT